MSKPGVPHFKDDCTCFDCLAKLADKDCRKCEGDGYVIVGPGYFDAEAMCECAIKARDLKAGKG